MSIGLPPGKVANPAKRKTRKIIAVRICGGAIRLNRAIKLKTLLTHPTQQRAPCRLSDRSVFGLILRGVKSNWIALVPIERRARALREVIDRVLHHL